MDIDASSVLGTQTLPADLKEGLKQVEPLVGGLTNQSWKLVTEKGACIWRPSSTLLSQLGVSRATEFSVLEWLKPFWFAPNVVHFSEKGIANQWIEGMPVMRAPSHAQMVEVLMQYHRLDVESVRDLPQFDYHQKINTYWQAIEPKHRFEPLQALYEWAANEPLPQATLSKPTLLHCDLGYYNLVETEQGLAIIDWEYACVGDPLVDVVLTAMACRYRLDTFVETYCQQVGLAPESIIEHAYELKFRFEIMSALWFVVCYQHNGDDSYLLEAQAIADALCRADH